MIAQVLNSVPKLPQKHSILYSTINFRSPWTGCLTSDEPSPCVPSPPLEEAAAESSSPAGSAVVSSSGVSRAIHHQQGHGKSSPNSLSDGGSRSGRAAGAAVAAAVNNRAAGARLTATSAPVVAAAVVTARVRGGGCGLAGADTGVGADAGGGTDGDGQPRGRRAADSNGGVAAGVATASAAVALPNVSMRALLSSTPKGVFGFDTKCVAYAK